jgi:hypothetical protein
MPVEVWLLVLVVASQEEKVTSLHRRRFFAEHQCFKLSTAVKARDDLELCIER